MFCSVVIGGTLQLRLARAQSVAPAEPTPAAEPQQVREQGPSARDDRPAPAIPEPAAEPDLAQEEEPGLGLGGEDPELSSKKGKKRRKKGPHAGNALGELRLRGRVLAQADLMRSRPARGADLKNSLDLELDSARISFEYQSPLQWLTAVAEFELAGKPDIKDAYIQARGDNLAARAGQFKLPVGIIDQESPWTLPTVRRGLIHDLLTDWLDVGGRRPGLMLSARAHTWLHPRLILGAFQGSVVSNTDWDVIGERELDRIERASMKAQSLVIRAQIEPGPLTVGAWSELRAASPSFMRTKHYLSAGIDAKFDQLLSNGGIRVWLDAQTGGSWYEHSRKTVDTDPAIYWSGRLLAAYRLGGLEDEEPYVEGFGLFGALDPDLDTSRDLVWESALGVSAGYYRRARLTLQAEARNAATNFPNTTGGYLAFLGVERYSLTLQAGVAF